MNRRDRGGQSTRRPDRRGRRNALRTLNPFDFEGRRERSAELHARSEEPYSYESNHRDLLIIEVILGLWIVLVLAVIYSDVGQSQLLNRWAVKGYTSVPPAMGSSFTQQDAQHLVDFAQVNGVNCNSVQELVNGTTACNEVLQFSSDVNDSDTLATIFFAILVILFAVGAVMISSFTYQASRNLLTLKSEEQRFSPTAAMLWILVPLLNFWRGPLIYRELWKASDPDASIQNRTDWKSKGSSWLITFWWAALVAAIFLGPRTVRAFFVGSSLQAHVNALPLLILADILLGLPAVGAFFVLRGIHQRQERRHAKVGPYTAVPKPKPPPSFE